VISDIAYFGSSPGVHESLMMASRQMGGGEIQATHRDMDAAWFSPTSCDIPPALVARALIDAFVNSTQR